MVYRSFICLEIVDAVRAIRRRRKEEIITFIRGLALDPFQKGDFQKMVQGREIEVKVFGRYSIYFWADHAVKVVKVIELLKSDD